MPRRTDKGRAKMKYPMSFKKMCNLVGIHPLKRVRLIKLMQENLKIESEVDDNNA